jgi:LacI family transcriptional regulator
MEIHTEDWRVDLLHSEDLPFVMIGHCRDSRDISFIDLDFEVGVVKAFDYLVELGHQRIGFLAYPPALHTSGLGLVAASDRGYATALEKYGLPRICREVAMETGAMEAATDELLNEEPALTAIVSLNGDVVVGVLRALRNRDIRVPDAFSVLGLTTTSTAMLMIPALTTLDFPTKQVGYDATKLLIQRLEDRESGVQQRLLEPALIVRESTGPAPT